MFNIYSVKWKEMNASVFSCPKEKATSAKSERCTKQFQHLQIIIIMYCYFSFPHIHHLQTRLRKRDLWWIKRRRWRDEGISACKKFYFCIEMMLGDICSLNPSSIFHVHCVYTQNENECISACHVKSFPSFPIQET